MAKKIKLDFDPYSFARVSVMSTALISANDYKKLIKMKFAELIKYLEESDYREEIDRLAIKYTGALLIEKALNENLIKTYKKLQRISNPGTNSMIAQYIKRKDFWNIKTIARAKNKAMPLNEIKDMLLPIGLLDEKKLDLLLKKNTVREIIEESGYANVKDMAKALKFYEENKSLSLVENALDKEYYRSSVDYAAMLPDDAKAYKEFLLSEVDLVNIETIIKLKKLGLKQDEIADCLVQGGLLLENKDLLSLIAAKDMKELFKEINKMPYRGAIKKSFENCNENSSLAAISSAIDNYLFSKTMQLHYKFSLSINTVIGYMFAKEIEIKNLFTIIKSKQLSLGEGFIEPLLITR
ncbi:MAG: ATP synthase A1 subunit C [archaeon]